MEKKLKTIFEYQRFEKNMHLDKLVSQTENRYPQQVSDDDLTLVTAAGESEKKAGIFPASCDKNN